MRPAKTLAAIATALALTPALGASPALAAPPPPAAPAPITPPALTAPLELPPAPPGRRDLATIVLVQLTVGVDGLPKDLVVVRAPNEQLGAVARDALARARFTPATQAGAPVAVRIVAPVAIGAPQPLVALGRREPEPTPTVAAGVSGQVLERGTRKPVAGVIVRLERGPAAPEGLEAMTDDEGRFAFANLPRGRYELSLPLFDEGGKPRLVSVPSTVTVRVTPDATREYRTRVEGRSSTTDAARITIPVERAREVPGSNGDPLKVIESLPGVARPAAAGPGAGELSVRGSAPEDTQTYIDGLPLFQLYHFGNIYSVLQDEWIGDIDFRAGGYSSEFGNATGGMVNVTLKDLPRDGAHGHGDVNVYHAAGLVTVPVSDSWTLGAAVRRSWVDAILGGIVGDDAGFRFSTAPRYYDYQLRADYHPDDATRVRLLAFGSDDDVVVLGGPTATSPGGAGFSLARAFHQVQGTLGLTLSDDLALSAGLATSWQRLRIQPGDNQFTLSFCPLTTRVDLDWRPSRELRVRGGLWAEVTRFKVDLQLPRPSKEGEVQLPTEVRELFDVVEEGYNERLDGWGEATWRPVPELAVTGGLRVLGWLGGFADVAPDARLAVGWRASDATELTVSGGVNHQAPAPDETAKSIGNPDLLPERAAYVDLGLEQRFGDLVSVELQGFYKALDQLVVPTGSRGGAPYDNAGTGTIYGTELLLRFQHPTVDAWLAYTLSRSRRVDRPGEPERAFSFDQTHVLAVVAGVQLGAGWRFGTRVRYATGNPYTPLEPAYFDAGADVWVPRAAGEPLSERSASFFQLDLRVDKTWLFDSWKLDLYLELNNATNRANIEAIRYSDDYTSREDITSLPLTPSIGIRGSF